MPFAVTVPTAIPGPPLYASNQETSRSRLRATVTRRCAPGTPLRLIGTVSLPIAANCDSVRFRVGIVIPFGALHWAYTVTDKVRSSAAHASN
jgi:hypothetical protein